MKRIAIVGAGLSGLTVAYRLGLHGHDVTVFEASPQVGGQLQTAREDDFTVELGAEGFVARSEAVPRLAHDLGMLHGDPNEPGQLLDQRATTSYRFEHGALRALAPGEAAKALNFQVDPSARGAGIRTFVGGMQALPDALAQAVRSRSTLHVGKSVGPLSLSNGHVHLDGQAFDRIVLATSSVAAGRILAPLVGEAAFVDAPTLSSVSVSLAFDAAQIGHALDGTGFVVGEPFEGFRACTFTTSKFAHRAPEGFVSLRAFFRPTPADHALEDADWRARAVRVLGRVLPIVGEPARAWVSRWPAALPVFDPAHVAAVAKVEQLLSDHPVHLTGSAFHGSGIDAAVRSAERLAEQLLHASS